MALIGLRNISLSYGGPPVLENIDLAIEPGERICLLGRNGAGKSTLMKIITGELQVDTGEVIRQQGLRTAYLSQQVPLGCDKDVFAVVAEGAGNVGELLSEFHHLSHEVSLNPDPAMIEKLDEVQTRMNAINCWQANQQVESIITRMGLDGEALFSSLSAGLKRRVLLAKGLVCKPDILLLDEPTNHLDIDAVMWVEDFLLKYEGTLVFVTHDRAFLQKLATRIIDVDRTRIVSFECSYDKYLERKDQMIADELRQNELFDKRLAEEEVWIRQGVRERRTRNEGRVRRLKAMREDRKERKELIGKVKVELQSGPTTGRKVIEAKHIGFSYNADKSNPIVKDFSTIIQRGDRVGIIGRNGSGKTTLIKLLLGQLETNCGGHVRHGTNLEVAYFDQLHSSLDLEQTVQENLCPGTDKIVINDKPRHVLGYLKDFLFTPKQARNVVANLSGGERNRLLLAKLFAQPANVLVLDEPTNDLDMETLELLEELLLEYEGTILMVSHDRQFLNNVVTSTIALEGNGVVKEYGGGFDDWLIQSGMLEKKVSLQNNSPAREQEKEQRAAAFEEAKQAKKQAKPRKMSFNERKELDAMPALIEKLEAQLAAINETMSDPAFFKKDVATVTAATNKAAQLDEQLQQAYTRWEQLEQLAADCN